jgi:hypothetical protein
MAILSPSLKKTRLYYKKILQDCSKFALSLPYPEFNLKWANP